MLRVQEKGSSGKCPGEGQTEAEDAGEDADATHTDGSWDAIVIHVLNYDRWQFWASPPSRPPCTSKGLCVHLFSFKSRVKRAGEKHLRIFYLWFAFSGGVSGRLLSLGVQDDADMLNSADPCQCSTNPAHAWPSPSSVPGTQTSFITDLPFAKAIQKMAS